MVFEDRGELLARCLCGEHGAFIVCGGLAHQPGALAGGRQRILVREDAGRIEGHDLPEAVTGRHIGIETGFLQHGEDGQRCRGERGLGVFHGGQRIGLRLGFGLAEGRWREGKAVETELARLLVAGGEIPGGTGFGEGERKLTAHADILAALTRHEIGELAGTCRREADTGALGQRCGFDRSGADETGNLACLGREILIVAGGYGRAAGRIGGEACMAVAGRDGEVFLMHQFLGRRLHCRGQRFRCLSRQHDEFSGKDTLRIRGELAGIFLQRDVEVRAAEAEGADRGAAWMGLVPDPGAQLPVHIERRASQRRRRLIDLDRRRQGLAGKRHDRLDQAGRSGGRLGMADLGLHRADGAPWRVYGFTVLAENELEP